MIEYRHVTNVENHSATRSFIINHHGDWTPLHSSPKTDPTSTRQTCIRESFHDRPCVLSILTVNEISILESYYMTENQVMKVRPG